MGSVTFWVRRLFRKKLRILPLGRAAQFRLVVPPRTTGERLVVVMESDPDRLWTLSELLSKMRARGWVNPSVRYQRETLRAAINSVARTNTAVERLGPTTYKYNRALAARGSQLAKEVVES